MGKLRFASLAALFVCAAAAAAKLSPAQVLYSTNQLNGQDITLVGVVTSLKALVTPDGQPYQSFKLCDAGACITVFTRDNSTYTEGKEITVTGHFWAVRHEGYTTRYNEIILDD